MLVFILFIIGFVLLVKGADYLVDGSEHMAQRFGVPTLVIGLTIVAIGTSLPELVVNIIAALQGVTDIALGTIIGSNIANTLLILGLSAVYKNIRAAHSTVWREIPFNLFAVFVLWLLINDSVSPELSRSDGLIFLVFLGVFFYYIYEMVRQHKKFKPLPIDSDESWWKMSALIIGGVIAVVIGAKFVVDGVVAVATLFGVPSFVIAATVVAVGTSLPELVTAIIALRRGHNDLLVGNVVGSNIINIFLVLGVTALIAPISASSTGSSLWFLVGSTILLMGTMFFGQKHTITRVQGVLFLVVYGVYVMSVI